LGQALSGSAAPSVSRVSLSLSPDGKRLAGNGGGTSVRVWDAWSPAAVQELRDDEVTHSLAWSPDGRFLACGTDVGVRLRDAETGLPAALLEGPEEPVTALAFSPDGKTLASAGATSLSVWLWRVADGEPVLLIPDALDGCVVEALAFHPNGRHLAAAGIDWLATGGSTGAVSVWDIEDRCEVATFGGGAVAVAFDPSGDRLAAASTEQTIFVWDLKTQQLALELAGHEEAVTCLAYSPDGRWLASGGDDWTVRLWDLAAGQQRASRQLDTQVKAVCFSPDGRSLFTANGNTTCYRLDVARLLS